MSIIADKRFDLVTEFLGYQNRKDNTNLPKGVLISDSLNVVSKTTGRVGIVKGYTIDGQTSSLSAGIESSFDTDMSFGANINLRSYTDPSTSKGVLQFRFKDANNVVTWNTITSTLNRGLLRYTRFFDYNTEHKDFILIVDNTSNVYEWSGGVTTIASVTANTLTKEGTHTW